MEDKKRKSTKKSVNIDEVKKKINKKTYEIKEDIKYEKNVFFSWLFYRKTS